MFDTILFPIDNSRETDHAVALVADIAKRYQSKLHLLAVLDDSVVGSGELDQARSNLETLLQKAESGLHSVGLGSVRTDVQEGKAAFVICDFADDLEADLIVMGCRGLTVAGDTDADSVCDRVINLAPCPVLVVP